ncbi:tetratricopeptide repeat protein [Sulfurimonas sp.]|uniref:tetratricopeptide repeat protein n=1 Tax=Sulfurimonas sp. TaxID=2022749 RepID=UPI0035674B1A
MAIDFYNAGMNFYEAGKHKEAYEHLIQDDTNPKCAFALGVMYYNGEGIDRDFKKSTHYYTVAAEAGIVPAQVSAGFAYANAMGVPQNFEKAVRYLKPASEAGEASAKITLAEIYAMGEVDGTRAEASKLIREVLSFSNSEEAMDVYNKYELNRI